MSQHRPLGEPRGGHARRDSGALGGSGARLAVAGCLLALVAVGLRGAVAAPQLNGPFRQHELVFGIVLEGVLACLMIALAVRHRRAPDAATLAARLRKLLTYVVGGAFLAIAIAYLPLRSVPGRPVRVPPRPSPAPAGLPRPAVTPAPASWPAAAVIVLVVLAVLIALALAYLAVRLARARVRPRMPRRPGGIPPEAVAHERGLREAVDSGYGALRLLDDARAAIIACYAAMEQSLARAGAARQVADTPDELLARAAGQGLVHGAAAARLTGLFYEARFSSHPMPRSRREDAEQALAELAANLDAGHSEPAGSADPGSGAGR